MQNESSDSVKITYLNREKVLAELEQCARYLKRAEPEVHRILLFGSLIHERYGPGSDADLLVVIDRTQGRIMDQIPRYLKYFSHVSIPVDIIPMTVQEFKKRQENKDTFISRIVSEAQEIGL